MEDTGSAMEVGSQPGGGEPRECNVCHLPYEGEECPWCKAEREGAAEVIQERGRRHTEAGRDGFVARTGFDNGSEEPARPK
jgi:hypothetical protein